MGHRVALAAFGGMPGYETAIVAEVFGLERPTLPHVDYELVHCRVEPGPLVTSHGLHLHADGDLDDLVSADTVVVPGWRIADVPTREFGDALCAAHLAGARIVGICSGAFALAHAGLLDAQRVATHWLYAARFRELFPDLHLDTVPLYVFGTNNTATSAGSSAGLDLCLALVAADHGDETAAAVANRLVVTHHRLGSQAQFSPGRRGIVPDDDPLEPLLAWLDDHLDQPLTIEDLAAHAHVSRRTLIRRFKNSTGMTPHAWRTQQRVHRARHLLAATRLPVDAVARRCGFASAAGLRTHFVAMTGLSPSRYRDRVAATSG